ncbi:hypothetical protein HDU92_006315 [Lobulomyces angularis]|nr:hypothetical protein HDU92_006315 [Lobulomyces angularis]
MTSPDKIFSIQGRTLTLDTADDVKEFCDQIANFKDLEEVRFFQNTLGIEACRALSKAIKLHKTLKVANLSDMFTRRKEDVIPVCLEAFVDALIDQPNLVEIDLSDNAFGPICAEPLMRLITQNRNIQTIKLNNNGLGIGGSEYISKALIEAAELNKKENKQSNLRTFVVGRNRMENQGAANFARAFERHTGLIEVRMPQNSIRAEGIEILVNSLGCCKSLEVLDLQDNTFTLKGSIATAKALQNWKSLRVLNIGECLLGAEGSKEIIKALTGSHNNLTTILLSYNELDYASAKFLPDMLEDKMYLEKLELNGNAFEADSKEVQDIKDILRGLGQEDALDELDDMEVPSDDEQEEEESESEEKSSDKNLEDLTDLASKLKIN